MIPIMQADPTANDQWRRYCLDEGIGVADPRLLEEGFVSRFLSEYEAGRLSKEAMVTDAMVEKITTLLASDAEAQKLWELAVAAPRAGPTPCPGWRWPQRRS